MVKDAWTKPQVGSVHSVLNKKLRETAKALRCWSKPLFNNAHLQLHIANEVILLLDIAQETRQLSSEELVLRQDLKIRILGLVALERCRRRQASRINYIRAGDACTRFFHLKMSARQRKQFVPMLRGEDSRLLWKHDEKEHIIQRFFHGLMG
jgi:hypothetical protein